MSTIDPDEAAVKNVFAVLVKLRERCLTQQLAVIDADFPELVDDARLFVGHVHRQPWQELTPLGECDLVDVLEMYSVQPCRERPSAEDVGPEVHLFYEACQLVEELEQVDVLRALLKRRWLPARANHR
jgi:hypothetical protein